MGNYSQARCAVALDAIRLYEYSSVMKRRLNLIEANDELRHLRTSVVKVHREIARYNKEIVALEHTLRDYEEKILSLELLILDKLSQSKHKNKH